MAESHIHLLLSLYVNGWKVDMSSMRTLMEAVAPDKRYEVVSSVRNWQEGTVIHEAVQRGQTKVVRCVMELLTEEESCKLIKSQDTSGQTAIHCAVLLTSHRRLKMLKCLLESRKVEERYQMLKIQEVGRCTAIHWAAWGGHTKTIRCLLDLLPPDKQIQLLDLQDVPNQTALDLAVEKSHTATIECLRLYKSNAETHLKQVQEGQREINIGNVSPASVQLARQTELIHEQNQQIRTLKRKVSELEESEKSEKAKNRKLESEQTDQKKKIKNLEDEMFKFKQEIAELKETVSARQEVITRSPGQSVAGPSFSNHSTRVGEVKKVMMDDEPHDVRIGELDQQARAANFFHKERSHEIRDQLADHAERLDDLAEEMDDLVHQMTDHEQRIENSEDRLRLLEGHNQPGLQFVFHMFICLQAYLPLANANQ